MIRNMILSLVTISITVSIQAQQNKLEKLAWLEGHWNRTDIKGEAQAFEQWELTDQGLQGLGVMLEEKDTIFVERLKILIKEGKLFYISDVAHNTKPTYFEIGKLGKTSFECVNATHDFPKKITYELNGNLLLVTISGNSRSMDFIFMKEEE